MCNRRLRNDGTKKGEKRDKKQWVIERKKEKKETDEQWM